MKLYFTKGACSLACRIIINEIGISCEYESVDLMTKKTQAGLDYYTINPKGAVPVLQISQKQILTENAVILQYLADTNNAEELLPPTKDLNRYRVLEWLNFVATELHKSFGPLFHSKIPQEIKNDFFIPFIGSKLSFLNDHFEKRTYLSGSSFTLPDAYLFVILTWAMKFKFDMNKLSHLARYFKQLQNRQSIQKSLEEEGLR